MLYCKKNVKTPESKQRIMHAHVRWAYTFEFSIFRSIDILENRKNLSRTMVEENGTLMQEVSNVNLIPEKHFLIH